jgi:hypothetical protein
MAKKKGGKKPGYIERDNGFIEGWGDELIKPVDGDIGGGPSGSIDGWRG